jgi:SAM-dependent methyltransferase
MSATDPAEQFAEKLRASIAGNTFVRLVFSSPVGGEPDKVLGRLVNLRSGPHLSLTFRYATRDVTMNLPVAEAVVNVREQLGRFRSALLSTTTKDWQLFVPASGQSRLTAHKPAATTAPARRHDRARQTLLDDSARDWLAGLGVMDAAGKVRKAMADKYRQINRYVEIFSHLTQGIELRTIADMGCGKGYLTFGMWHLLRRRPVKIIGVEQRPELVEAANRLAQQIGASGLEFIAGTIESVELPAVDALIALHACDTATDDAIRRGIDGKAKLIMVAPCCHKEVRPQLGKPEPLAPVLAHGLMAERMAEWATDGLRALYLEAAGYRTKMIEFVGSEHTPKNLMIAGIRTGRPTGREKLERFRAFLGIRHHALD